MQLLSEHPCESAPYYLPSSEEEIASMLEFVGKKELRDLFAHLPSDIFLDTSALPEEQSYQQAAHTLEAMAEKNKILPSFLGDGLPDVSLAECVAGICEVRGLTTAYTPYQPERSQGTLISLWIYQCAMAALTGFEAVNCSLYDRSTALFEALSCARRSQRKNTVLLAKNIYPNDWDVVQTLAARTALKVLPLPAEGVGGLLDKAALRELLAAHQGDLAALAFPQVNHLGLLEDVDFLTDLSHASGALAIAIVDPLLLAKGGLKPASHYGKEGADLMVGEGQHLAIAPNFGGPGLGVFAVKAKHKTLLRNSAGRYVGKAKDKAGRECFAMILSTREQHIRKERATSNICSNQAFLATLIGASLLERGDEGLAKLAAKAHDNARAFLEKVELSLAYPQGIFFNEITLDIKASCPQFQGNVANFIEEGLEEGLLLGVDVSSRAFRQEAKWLKLSFSDKQSAQDLEALAAFFQKRGAAANSTSNVPIPQAFRRSEAPHIPSLDKGLLVDYYRKLGDLNANVDQTCYPLGSCTMKFNPHLNDYTANLKGFTQAHPQAPSRATQGCLEVLYHIQEQFKAITGLDAVTTQPVAGAQGELLGLKLFQAYHADRGERQREVVFITQSAHGTNFATAAVAGLSRCVGENIGGSLVVVAECEDGSIDMEDLEAKIQEHGPRLCGIMITNPNTRGLFEPHFKEIARKVREAGGLVYLDGANMNAIAGWVDLKKLGVDAAHQNLHKTWSIPHGGGGPGDAVVGVDEKLAAYLPGIQVVRKNGIYQTLKCPKSIGMFHRHFGNFAHKVRALTYLLRLGKKGMPKMSALAVLSANYVLEKVKDNYRLLPAGNLPRMHEFILTLKAPYFKKLEKVGLPKAAVMPALGKLFLDFGFHAPTIAWPEPLGMMIEPTESFTQAQLDRFADTLLAMLSLIEKCPEALLEAPRTTPVDKVDEAQANRQLCLSEPCGHLPVLHHHRLHPKQLLEMPLDKLSAILAERP